MASASIPDFSSAAAHELGRLGGAIDELRKNLLGNGQPGRIQQVEDRIEELDGQYRTLNQQYERTHQQLKTLRRTLLACLWFAVPSTVLTKGLEAVAKGWELLRAMGWV